MKKLLPIILLILGAGGGVGAGLYLRPPPAEHEMAAEACADGDAHCPPPDTGGHAEEVAPAGDSHSVADTSGHGDAPAEASSGGHGEAEANASGGPEYVALQRQMIVPIVSDDKVISLVVMSLSIEVAAGFSMMYMTANPS